MKVIVVFASFVGNTETMSNYIVRGLEQNGHEVLAKDVIYSKPEELLDYDLILLGSPTYEPKMIHDDMLPFYDTLATMDLSGKKAAAFGPGDSAWPDFCTAVEMLEERLKETGAEIVATSLTVDGIVEEHEERITAWGASFK